MPFLKTAYNIGIFPEKKTVIIFSRFIERNNENHVKRATFHGARGLKNFFWTAGTLDYENWKPRDYLQLTSELGGPFLRTLLYGEGVFHDFPNYCENTAGGSTLTLSQDPHYFGLCYLCAKFQDDPRNFLYYKGTFWTHPVLSCFLEYSCKRPVPENL